MGYEPKTYRKDGGDTLVVASGGKIEVESGGQVLDSAGPLVHNVRTRFTIAQVNAGATILAAAAGYQYRLVDAAAIAVGGNVGAVTTVDILGTQTTSVKLVAFAQASLTQSTVLRAGDSGGDVLADGASFVANDANTAITIDITGSDATVATHIDVLLSYTVEAV